MKAIISTMILMTLLSGSLLAQTTDGHHLHKDAHGHDIDPFYLKLVNDADSISGFDSDAALREAKLHYEEVWQQKRFIAVLERNYIDHKYSMRPPPPADPGVQAPCTNVDFETGNANGWTLTQGPHTNSQTMAGCCPTPNTANFQVVTPGNDINVGAALQRVPPGGGNYALLLGRTGTGAGGLAFRARQTFSVTPANSVFVYKYAVVLNASPHNCNEQPFFTIAFTGPNGPIPCSAYQVTAIGQNCQQGDNSFITSGVMKYKPWTTSSFDLSAYMGQNVTIEFTVGGCVSSQGAHGGYCYIDASCQPMSLNLNGNTIAVGSTNNFICSTGTNTLCAPPGFTSYTWSGPGATGLTGQCINISGSGTYSVTLGMAGSSCSSPVLHSNFSILTPPTADFTFTTTPCQTTFTVPFQSTSSGNGGPAITSYTWNWGGGLPNGSAASETPTFPTSGVKTVTLTVSNGCTATAIKTITLTPKPVANFNLANICQGAVSSFTGTSVSSLPLLSQVWTWGDNTPNGMGANPTHVYAAPNTYSVNLKVTDANLCTDSITKPITIYPNPTVSFTASPVCMGTPVSFINNSAITSGTVGYAWDFDNNGTTDNTTQSPTNNYGAANTYTVRLTATSNNNCITSNVTTVRVNALPTATFTPQNACIGANIVLNNASSVPLPDNIALYTWDFGGGSTPASSTMPNPPSLTYNTSGTKTIKLDISTNTTCTASITKTVTVYPSPVANFSATAVCQATQTAFTDLSTTGTGTVNAWKWDFTSDGVTDNLTQNPGFTYPASGTYTASLEITASTGCTHTLSVPVNVWGHTIPNFSPDNVCHGAPTTFSNSTNTTTNPNTGGTPGYTWVFDDGSPNSVAVNPVHSYTLGTNGNAVFNVTLTATSTNGCVDYIIKPVNVYSTPTASFTANLVCNGSPTQFTDASNGNGNVVNGYNWDFLSDGTIDITGTATPNFIFPNYGTNSISYTVSTNPIPGLTCSNSISTITAYVNPNPIPDFTFINRCINAQPNTFDASVSMIAVGTNTNYAWAFGDGNTASGLNNTHNYLFSGPYNVTLTVTSDQGCVKTVVKQVDVYEMPKVNILFKNACDGAAVTFTAEPLPGSGTVTDWYWDYDNDINTIEFNGQPTASFIYPSAGQQTVGLVVVSNPGQCRDIVKNYPYVNYLPEARFRIDDPEGCSKHCIKLIDTSSVTLPAVITNWTWDLGDGSTPKSLSTNDGPANCYENLKGNQLEIFNISLEVTTDRGCTSKQPFKSIVTVFPLPTASYEINPDPGNVVTPLEYFTNNSQNYTRWYWTFGDGGYNTDSTTVNPTHFYNSETAKTYYTNLLVYNQYGCSDRAVVPIEIGPEFAFYVPNAFTPFSTDGVNDVFTGNGIGIEKYDMWIFDRWGEMIFYTNDIAKGWDGKRSGKSQEVKQEVFVYKIKVRDVMGNMHDYVGHVTLLR